MVEPLALRRTMERADDAWRAAAEPAGASLRAAYRARPFDRSEYEAEHHDFHAALVANAGPTWWPRIATLLRDQTARYRAVDVKPRDLAVVMAEHEQMLVTCLAGNVDGAVEQLKAHILASREQMNKSFARCQRAGQSG